MPEAILAVSIVCITAVSMLLCALLPLTEDYRRKNKL